jgi:hypothetical protein
MRITFRMLFTASMALLLSGCLAPVMMAPAMLPALMPSLGLMTATTAGTAALQQGAAGGGGLTLPFPTPAPPAVRQTATARQTQLALSRARAAEAKLRKSDPVQLPDYLAVDTSAGPRSPDGTIQIMVYDTAARSMASDEIFNFRRAPKLGAKQTFGPFRAQYFGEGRISP